MSKHHLFCFGFGFSAQALARRLLPRGWRITGTARSEDSLAKITDMGAEALVFDGTESVSIPDDVSHILISVPPDADGDVVLRQCARQIAALSDTLSWVGYLSTTGVYGNRDGDWVDETSKLVPSTQRGERRVTAERAWLELHDQTGLPVMLFRLAGIYGPGRNQLVSLKNGKSRRVVKPGQVFSRIHVDDIAQTLEASIDKPNPGQAYNVCDDLPAPPQDVVAFAAELMGMPPPPEVPFDAAEMSAMGRSFYAESKRVHNERIKNELGVELIYPDYKAGLKALFEKGDGK
ncbi:MAG: SDR family oxidoreductase [Hyphomicrobiales bacterium]